VTLLKLMSHVVMMAIGQHDFFVLKEIFYDADADAEIMVCYTLSYL